ncbi:MAG: PAS domain S-box protein [Mucilaginibacter sp.]
MSTAVLSFKAEQFERIFPFYILVNEGLRIDSVGTSLHKLYPDSLNKPFSASFEVREPKVELLDISALRSICGHLITIVTNNNNILRGQFEFLDESNQWLFIGSPWFNSMDGVKEADLNLGDFSIHDPLIDLQYVNKTQENLKHLLTTVNDQQNEIKKNQVDLIRLSQLASVNENGVLFTDDKGVILWVNEGFCEILGYTQDEILGKRTLDFCRGPHTDEVLLKSIAEEIGIAESFNKALIHYRKDGSWFWARVKGQSFKIEQEQAVQYFAVVEDITSEKEKEEQLRVLSKIAEDNINAVIITDKYGCINWVNKGFTRITGYTLPEVINRKPGHVLQGPGTDPKTVAYLKEQITSGQPFNTEIVNYNKNGNPYWLRVQGQPILNSSGDLTGFFALEEDITKEKELQQILQKSESQFRVALEKIGDNVWEHNFQTGETHFSKANNELWGYLIDQSTNIERLWWDNVYPDDLHILKENYLRYQKQKNDAHSLEYRIVHQDGSIKWVLDRGGVIERDGEGKPLRIIGTHTDITKIKQTETELEQRVNQFRSLSENIPGIIYEYEFMPDGTEGLRYISPALERVFGIKTSDFKNYLSYIHPDDHERIKQKNLHCRNTLEPFYDESRLLVPGKSLKWHAVHSSFSYTSQNGTKVFTGFMMDITERKNVEQALRANEEKYRSIIENMNLGLLEVDNHEKITYANQRFCTMCGYTIDELNGQTARKFLMNGNHNLLLEQKLQERKKGIADAYEVSVVGKDGSEKWWLISGAPRYNDRGDLVGSIGIHLDITEQKKLELQLIEARERAEHLARTKESFLANMSHEIRTPMNAIMGMSRQLSKTNLGSQQQFYLDIIHTASDNLLVIINDILDLSKVDAGKLSFEHIGFELKTVIARAIEVLAHKAEEKGLRIACPQFDNGISPVLMGDPTRLNQVLLNLIGNAIKFTETGGVDVYFSLAKDNSTSQVIEVRVVDSGIGMEESFIKRIFDKFSQANESVTRKYGGTGLGMSICKNLVELMGGEIIAKSKKGQGTTITFWVELEKGTVADLPETEIIQFKADFLEGRKILITDDNELNRLVASIIVQNYGARVIEANNGQQAIDAIKNNDIDLVLMDIQMPVMNGNEATKILRQRGFLLPIIALTAEAIKGEREKCIALGMDDYITKPIKEEEFLKVIDKILKAKDPENNQTTTKMSNEPLYDLSELKAISRGNDTFVTKMASMFCEQTPVMVHEMIKAYHAHDLEKMGSVAHKMKPSFDSLKIKSLAKIIRDLEVTGKNKSEDPNISDWLEMTENTVANVVKQMKAEYNV